MKKIVIAGLMMDTNLGEEIYPRCLCHLVKEIKGHAIEFDSMDLYGRTIRCENSTTFLENDNLLYSVDWSFIQKVLIKCCYKILGPKFPGLAKYLVWFINPNDNHRLKRFYREKIEDADIIVFPGGGIIECSTNHDYFNHINLITKIAEQEGIPVCFNAVGKVVDESHMFGWRIMKKALNRKCVKSISCRDGNKWINENIFDRIEVATTVPCCAIYADETYKIKYIKRTNVVGIGVIRGNVFTSYGINFDEECLLHLYEELISLLIHKGYSCHVFTNGYSLDVQFADKLRKKLIILAWYFWINRKMTIH